MIPRKATKDLNRSRSGPGVGELTGEEERRPGAAQQQENGLPDSGAADEGVSVRWCKDVLRRGTDSGRQRKHDRGRVVSRVLTKAKMLAHPLQST